MVVSVDDIKELRRLTGAGILTCRKVLVDVGGNIEAAIELIRKQYNVAVLKKSGRDVKFGAVFTAVTEDCTCGVLIEVACETDFVAKSSIFIEAVKCLASFALSHKIRSVEELVNGIYLGNPVSFFIEELINKFSENIRVTKLYLREVETGCIGCYNHYRNNIPSFGALVVLNCINYDLAHDLAVHVAVSCPLYISYSDIPEDVIQKEYITSKETYLERYKDKGDVILRKIVESNVKGKFDSVILMEQFFFKEQSVKVCELLLKNKAEVSDFCYARVGA